MTAFILNIQHGLLIIAEREVQRHLDIDCVPVWNGQKREGGMGVRIIFHVQHITENVRNPSFRRLIPVGLSCKGKIRVLFYQRIGKHVERSDAVFPVGPQGQRLFGAVFRVVRRAALSGEKVCQTDKTVGGIHLHIRLIHQMRILVFNKIQQLL